MLPICRSATGSAARCSCRRCCPPPTRRGACGRASRCPSIPAQRTRSCSASYRPSATPVIDDRRGVKHRFQFEPTRLSTPHSDLRNALEHQVPQTTYLLLEAQTPGAATGAFETVARPAQYSSAQISAPAKHPKSTEQIGRQYIHAKVEECKASVGGKRSHRLRLTY